MQAQRLALSAMAAVMAVATYAPAWAERDPTPEEREAVLDLVDRWMIAYHDKDIAALRDLFEPPAYLRGVFTHTSGDADAMHYRVITLEEWLTDLAGDDSRGVITEVYWSPSVQITADTLATVWAHYEFQVDGVTSHCGVDLFTLVKPVDTWRIAEVTFTLDTTMCEDERPSDLSTLRPEELQDEFVPPADAADGE